MLKNYENFVIEENHRYNASSWENLVLNMSISNKYEENEKIFLKYLAEKFNK